DFEAEARSILQKKKNLRLIRLATSAVEVRSAIDMRSVCGGVLVQDADVAEEITRNVVSKRRPTKTELNSMSFGWRVVKHVKSNAIVYARADRTLGIGAGQMSRIDASRIAIWKANEAGLSLKGSAVASDAFFPFPDGLSAAAVDGGAEDELTLRANRRAFEAVTFRPRCAVATPACDLRITVLGTPLSMPLILAPIGSSRLMYQRGEEAAARAAGAAGIAYALSTLSGCPLEDVAAASKGPVWYQLYLVGGRDCALSAIERARAAGFSALVVTIDTPVAGMRE